jgi:hypothetical protein
VQASCLPSWLDKPSFRLDWGRQSSCTTKTAFSQEALENSNSTVGLVGAERSAQQKVAAERFSSAACCAQCRRSCLMRVWKSGGPRTQPLGHTPHKAPKGPPNAGRRQGGKEALQYIRCPRAEKVGELSAFFLPHQVFHLLTVGLHELVSAHHGQHVTRVGGGHHGQLRAARHSHLLQGSIQVV